MNILYGILLGFFATIVAADDPYIPCKSYISFSYDDSNFIKNDDFKTQINFIKSVIGNLNHPERLRAEGGYTAEFNWNSGLSISQMVSSFDFSQQTLMSYSLLQQFASLLTSYETLDTPVTDPIGALIFISDTSERALQNADRFMTQLSNVKITFVLLGPDADQNKLTQFSSNFITWRDLSQPQPDNWDALSTAAYGCPSTFTTYTASSVQSSAATTQLPSSGTDTTYSTSTASSASTSAVTGSTLIPYFPCESMISFSYDDSSALQSVDYRTQMNFISSALSVLNYSNRLRIQGAFTDVASWNSGQTVSQMQNELSVSEQTSNSYSLLQQFASLVNSVQVLGNSTTFPIGALIFISDTSDTALANAIRLLPFLSNVRITFVLLGQNVDSSKLTQFSSNFITWSDLSQPQPDNWDALSAAAYGCSNPITMPTISTGSSSSATYSVYSTTSATFSPFSTASTSSGTSVTVTSSGSTNAPAYYPCQSWISFCYDDSNALQPNDYKTQISFISTAIDGINYINRLRIEGAYTGVASWNSGQTIDHLKASLNSTEQSQISYSLLQEFASLATSVSAINGTNSWQIGAIIFISDTSDNALRNADRFLPQLAGIRITFVLLGQNVDSSKLTQFSSNFINWSDLSQPQPDNWDALSAAAYGC